MFEDIFFRKKADSRKLTAYGFFRRGEAYQYEANIMNGEFRLTVTVKPDAIVDTSLTETDNQEPFTLYKTNAEGTYLGEVRTAVADVLSDICKNCYVDSYFRGAQSEELRQLIFRTYGDEPEFPWKNSLSDAIWRRKDNRKWYGVFLTVPYCNLDPSMDERSVEILNLKGDPALLPRRIDGRHTFPAWHMNKTHWFTVLLDGSLPLASIADWVEVSYRLAKS